MTNVYSLQLNLEDSRRPKSHYPRLFFDKIGFGFSFILRFVLDDFYFIVTPD